MSTRTDRDATATGAAFARLVGLMAALRAPDGCAWDREQTIESLRPFIIEETYEVIDAIDRDDRDALRHELGDFLLEAVFVAQICDERGDFHIRDAIEAVCDKLVRRHPHIFGRAGEPRRDLSSTEVKQQWEAIKASERDADGGSPGLLGGIPDALPGLLRAYRLGRRAATVGFDWPGVDGVEAKVAEELAELAQARAENAADAIEDEVGDLLFAMANLARRLDVDPETALRRANRKFTARFGAVEAALAARGVALRDASLDEMEAEWQRAKLNAVPGPRT